MEITIYETKAVFEVLPTIAVSCLDDNERKKRAWCILAGWLFWTIDFQWENDLEEDDDDDLEKQTY